MGEIKKYQFGNLGIIVCDTFAIVTIIADVNNNCHQEIVSVETAEAIIKVNNMWKDGL